MPLIYILAFYFAKTNRLWHKMIFILFNFGLLWLIKKCFNVRNMFDKVFKVMFFMILGEKNGWWKTHYLFFLVDNVLFAHQHHNNNNNNNNNKKKKAQYACLTFFLFEPNMQSNIIAWTPHFFYSLLTFFFKK
jgi:hypothetical protein